MADTAFTAISEVWKPAPGFEGRYEVSSVGRIRSTALDTVCDCGFRHTRKAKVLTPQRNERGYAVITLNGTLGERKGASIHSLVCRAFHGPRPVGMYALHKDGNPANNRVDNLRWGTPQENSDDAKGHGAILAGERHPGRKLSDAEVTEIRDVQLCRSVTLRDLATQYGVTRHYIWKLRKGLYRAP